MYAIVFFPNNLPNEIQEFRRKYDFKWDLIPPHITLVFPFKSTDENQLIKHIQEKMNNVRPFDIIIDGYMKSQDHYLYLTLKRGDFELMNLHDSLYTGVLQQNLRTDIPYIPHLTIGNFQNENCECKNELYSQAQAEIKPTSMYYEGQVDSLTLIEITDQLSPRRLVTTLRFNG